MTRILGLVALIALATASAAFASTQVPVVAPELDASTAVAALTLLSGSVAVLRARLKK